MRFLLRLAGVVLHERRMIVALGNASEFLSTGRKQGARVLRQGARRLHNEYGLQTSARVDAPQTAQLSLLYDLY